MNCVKVLSTERLLPLQNQNNQGPCTIDLTAVDAPFSGLNPAFTVSVFDRPPVRVTNLAAHLRTALTKALDRYPFFAGELHWKQRDERGKYGYLGTPRVAYGSSQDPGIEWTVGELAMSSEELVPDARRRFDGTQMWVKKDFPEAELRMASGSKMAPQNPDKPKEDRPVVTVQLTLLSDGGYAIGMRISHSMAEGHTVATFMSHFASESRIAYSGRPDCDLAHPPTPIFDPRMADVQAMTQAEAEQQALALPLLRSDWQALSRPETAAVENAPTADHGDSQQTWPCVIISYTAAQISHIVSMAREVSPKVSRLVAILAHLWLAVQRAEHKTSNVEKDPLAVSMSLRGRFSPSLPEGFVGSPVVKGLVQTPDTPSSDASLSRLGEVASNIHEVITACNAPNAAAAIMQSATGVKEPSKLLGDLDGALTFPITNSWMRHGIQRVDFFGTGAIPRCAFQVLLVGTKVINFMEGGTGDNTMDVAVYLEEETLKRLMDDPMLIPGKGCS